jgi:hypothetical protein
MNNSILYIIVDSNYNVVDKYVYRAQHGVSVFKSLQQAKEAYRRCKTKMDCWLVSVPLRYTHTHLVTLDTINGMV